MMEEDLRLVPNCNTDYQVPELPLLPRTQTVLVLWPADCGKNILAMLLTSADYIIRSVGTEAEALEYLYRERYLAIVFDASIFDGHDLQHVAELRRIPCIAISTPRENRGKTGLNDTAVKEILTSLFTLSPPSWVRQRR